MTSEATTPLGGSGHALEPDDERFRSQLVALLARTGLSRRGLSRAMGRDPGYVAALLDPARPSRARPTPTDLLRCSDATGVSFIELLSLLWAIPLERLVREVTRRGLPQGQTHLTNDEQRELETYAAFLVDRRRTTGQKNADRLHPRTRTPRTAR